ncbi:TetR/AcrR family transcriptional regulator [Paeniglutamicibacter sp. NPDC012692]|uniref:TetR/AcrR family transcriptional regulator n=1 Tax=Paeniglutamicibacter sp. NPDC012692 TaxID=3364388 RepID=UPI0036AFA69D
MSENVQAIDRRSEIKAKHRRSIVKAAASIMRSRLTSDFTVDELAREADVSRRTIFNHFASLDDVVVEACAIELESFVEQLASAPPTDPSARHSIFDELAEAVRSTDLISPLVHLTQIMGVDSELSPRQALVCARTLTEISQRLVTEMCRRHPEADALTINLMVSSMTNGLVVMYFHFLSTCGAVVSTESRELWDQLLERLIEPLRTGFGTP